MSLLLEGRRHGRTEKGIFVGYLPLISYCFDADKFSKLNGIV